MELLAPAGSNEAVIAAVQSGADAIYIGGSSFSARQSAKNFTLEEMKKQIDYCHIRGTEVHVAANILIKDRERDDFLEYISKVNEMGADALIIQDIGMASLVKKYFPDLPLHASTQMTIASLDAVKFLEENGFSRVVLSRELSEEEIAFISQNSKIETEVFVHGALCICYSGQCLMSSIIGGRSGNRGMCAQPCRLFYELLNEGRFSKSGHLLSPKDLALLDNLKSLEKTGVASLKIEGRLKRPEYVAAVTGIYRKALDFTEKPSDEDWKELLDAFNRSGFTNGYFTGNTGKKMMSIKNPGNASENKFTDKVLRRCRAEANEKKVGIDIYAKAVIGRELELTFADKDFNTAYVKGTVKAESAETASVSKERLSSQLAKLGNTPFDADNIEIILDEGISLPISEINSVRRMAALRLEHERSKIKKRRAFPIEKRICVEKNSGYIFSAQVLTMEQAQAVLEFNVPVIYSPSELAEKIKILASDRKVVTVLPPVWREKDKKYIYISDGVLVYNIGQIKAFSDYDCFGGFRLNVFNSDSLEFYRGLKSTEISYELNLNEIKGLSADLPLEALVYGRIPLMVLGNCPQRAYSSCGTGYYLRDRRKQDFPLICQDGCYSQVLNSKPLYMADKTKDLKNTPISIFKLSFTVESGKECRKILSEYFNAFENNERVLAPKENSFTRGHYYRTVE